MSDRSGAVDGSTDLDTATRIDGDAIASIIERARAADRTTLTEAESKSLLDAAGIETPDRAVVGDPEEAITAAEAIGYPVVAKVSSAAVTHKSEWADGAGVALDLADADAVADATAAIREAAAAEGIDAEVLIEDAADLEGGTETIVGGMNTPSFGPVTLVGLGGVFAEVYEDTAHRIAPVSEPEARAAVESLTAAPLLSGYRGRPPGDVDALVETIRAVGDLLVETPAIDEIDVNPVLVSPDGAVALDALVVLEG
ncbi:acetyl-CoA synthetase (ADP-forming) beta subunit /branched-chain acyl-CoA synthetase (ADP-forming) beta subunit [Halopenitus malekzadehii]|uniref:acetate--CoA ligase (ADP-forming) n=1 Tax=Halopenitus malekzadehii TaxID=1267564 RepID=A0A1H6I8I4_9EURY|nr:acetate--CoA ligase family protein [Halopenitus malekzadehii]SEH42636.1 acetyl-CoA synthetase (ADP-forming) beta subunit /branched-chain acyl-CoA synthetase (ADP-forming) beta subunit [Halopenitus malekzadehii]